MNDSFHSVNDFRGLSEESWIIYGLVCFMAAGSNHLNLGLFFQSVVTFVEKKENKIPQVEFKPSIS